MENSVLNYFEKVVDLYPHKIALVDGDSKLTFEKLREKALTIAYEIEKKTSKTKRPILVILPKNNDCIASFLGILYSGNFYTPTDARYPFAKINSVLDILKPELIITNSKYSKTLFDKGFEDSFILNIDELVSRINPIDVELRLNKIISIDPVYTFFTSGSTGIPKGVTINNLNIMHHIEWLTETFEIDSNTIMGNLAPLYFDISTHDVYCCLCKGATLVLIPESYTAYPYKILEFMNEHRVNTIHWVPSAYSMVAEMDLLNVMPLSTLKLMIFSGEIMPSKILNYWLKNTPSIITAANLYGPTEATVDCSYYIVDRTFQDHEVIPIGKSCRNVDLFVLDSENNLVTEIDTPGELYIRGATVSAGYWNDFERTKDSFIQNPQNSSYPEIVYKTGDLVYYNKNSDIVFIGRKDSQIKHQGYRIELGEIENAAYGIEEIHKVCCLYDNEMKSIVMFYVSKKTIEVSSIKKSLQQLLPRYMIPDRYVVLEKLPLNANGKVDRVMLKRQYELGV